MNNNWDWDPKLWNLRMWVRSRGYIEYFRRDRRYDRWSKRFRIDAIVNSAYKEYESWASATEQSSSSRSSSSW